MKITMGLALVIGGLGLVGCEKKHSPIAQSTPSSSVGVIMGQSNSLYMGQKDAALIQGSMGVQQVINCGVASTNMARWQPSGDLYQACMAMIPSGAHVSFIMFWQGESDSSMGSSEIDLWPSRFRSMVNDLRGRFGGGLPVAYAEITNTGTPGRDLLRSYQSGFYMPGVRMVSSDGITMLGDHTDDNGYQIMAGRFCQALG